MPNEAWKDAFYTQQFCLSQPIFFLVAYYIARECSVTGMPASDNKDILAYIATGYGICRESRSHDFGNALRQRCHYHSAIAGLATIKAAFYDGLPVNHNNDMTIPDNQVKRLKQRRNFSRWFAGDFHASTKSNQLCGIAGCPAVGGIIQQPRTI